MGADRLGDGGIGAACFVLVARRELMLAEAARRMHHDAMPPDPSGYEERYRLTRHDVAPPIVYVVLSVVSVIWFHTLIIIVVGGAAMLPYIILIAGRRVAFRADYTGITLGVNPTGRKFYATRIPWADVEMIVLYTLRWHSRGEVAGSAGTRGYIGIQRREGAPSLPHGNQPALNRPGPRVAAGATRDITTWRLDRNRLAAVIAVVAPAVRIFDYGTIDVWPGGAQDLPDLESLEGLDRGRACLLIRESGRARCVPDRRSARG